MAVTVTGTFDDDSLTVTVASKILAFGGDDTIVGSAFDDVVDTGHELWKFIEGDVDEEDEYVTVGDDDNVQVGSGNDHIAMGPGTDTIYGGAGIDSVSFIFALGSFRVPDTGNPPEETTASAFLDQLVVDLSAKTYSGRFKNGTKLDVSVSGILDGIESVTGTARPTSCAGRPKTSSSARVPVLTRSTGVADGMCCATITA